MFASVRVAALVLLILSSIAACRSGDTAPDATRPKVTVGDAWVRATPPGAAVAGGYLTLTNTSDQPLRLVAVETPAAARVEIHEQRTVDGVMQMRPLTDGVLLDPGQPVNLAPGGIHLMLMAPPVALAAGEAVTLRLVFEGADAVEIEAPVRAVAPAAGEAAHH